MTTQEMFDLLRDYAEAVRRVDEAAIGSPEEQGFLVELALNKKRIAEKVAENLPLFTPMSCRNCVHYQHCNRSRPFAVCEEYDVED